MKVKVIIDLGKVRREDLEEIAKYEEIVGGWKALVEQALEFGLDNFCFDYDIDYAIEEVEEVKNEG